MRFFYTLLLYLLTPLLFIGFILRGADYRHRLWQRFGFIPWQTRQPLIWLHAASVGEVMAAQPVIERLLLDYPDHRLVVTTYTASGFRVLSQRFGDRVSHAYLPHDLPGSIKRFYRRLQPKVGIIMETELWPNLHHYAAAGAIPLVIINARLSVKSHRFYRGPGRLLFRPLLQKTALICAQSNLDSEYLLSSGARADRLQVCGNLKYDVRLPADTEGVARELRRVWGQRPVWLAASTHDGEEALVLEAHRRLLQRIPDLLLVLVPRHPQRFEKVAGLVRGGGLKLIRRSEHRDCDAATQVFLGDSMGELGAFFQAADVVFMGGSLVATGGHNPLEPAAVGKAVITGPHIFNFQEIYQLLLTRRAASQIDSIETLLEQLEQWLAQPDLPREMGNTAQQVVQDNRGATDCVMKALAPYLQ